MQQIQFSYVKKQQEILSCTAPKQQKCSSWMKAKDPAQIPCYKLLMFLLGLEQTEDLPADMVKETLNLCDTQKIVW